MLARRARIELTRGIRVYQQSFSGAANSGRRQGLSALVLHVYSRLGNGLLCCWEFKGTIFEGKIGAAGNNALGKLQCQGTPVTRGAKRCVVFVQPSGEKYSWEMGKQIRKTEFTIVK